MDSLLKHPFKLPTLIFIIISLFIFPKPTLSSPNQTSSTTLSNNYLKAIQFACKSTPYPDVCFNSLKLSISINIPLNILNLLLQSLQDSINEATKLSSLLSSINPGQHDIIESQKGSLQDCEELHEISLLSLQKSISSVKLSKLDDAGAFLSAALTNKDTCLEGLASATGPQLPYLVNSITDAYKRVSNSLSMLSDQAGWGLHLNGGIHHRRLFSKDPPSWARRILDDYSGGGGGGDNDYNNNDESLTLVVAKDGSGNFTNVQDAIDFAPNNSDYRTFIYVRQGIYEEYVQISINKANIVLLGDGSDVTVITGKRSVADGWTTFRSATVAVSGEGFLARGITFENTAGPAKRQAVALRINADFSAAYECTILGYQDTLYVHSFRQFYRECDIYGTIDYIFGNAAVVFQACNIVSRMPLPRQFTVVTAQSRNDPGQNTGMSIQNCSILATEELYANRAQVKSYLGRPWRNYSTTVYIESYIDDFIDPKGWIKWEDHGGVDKLYYGEYDNRGPGSNTSGRVDWEGYHIMSYDDASNFTVSQLIVGDEWLDSTSFPYDNGV